MRKNHNRINKCIRILQIVFLWIGITHFIIGIAYIPTESMEPTIKGKSLIIEYRLPYNMMEYCRIERGDIISFTHEGFREIMCKRVIGLPGEEISFRNGDVYINGKILEEGYCLEKHSTFCNRTIKIPSGCIFCMGDNRRISFDCRDMAYPFVELKNVQGKMIAAVSW